MKGKDLLILLVLAAVAGAVLYTVSKRARAAWSESVGGGGKVIEFPINDVARLKIKSPEGEVNLLKKGDGWVVHERADYPASFDEVSAFVRRLWELRVGQPVKVGPSQMARLELVEPGHGDKAGTLIEVANAEGKTLAALLLGKQYGSKPNAVRPDLFTTAKGRYVKTASGKVFLATDGLDDAVPNPPRWLLKDFVRVTPPKSVAVRGPNEAEAWTLTRENANAEWKLADARPGEEADNSRFFRLRQVFSAPSFVDVLAPDADPTASGLDKPTVARIDTFDGFHYELKMGKASTDTDTLPLLVSVSADLPSARTAGEDEKPEDKAKLDEAFKAKQKQLQEKLAKEQRFAGRAFLVPKAFVEDLLKERAALLADKPAGVPAPTAGATNPPPAAAPGSVPPPVGNNGGARPDASAPASPNLAPSASTSAEGSSSPRP